jgi:hypothetical protein
MNKELEVHRTLNLHDWKIWRGYDYYYDLRICSICHQCELQESDITHYNYFNGTWNITTIEKDWIETTTPKVIEDGKKFLADPEGMAGVVTIEHRMENI